MSPYLAEGIGTMILVILGDGVVANAVLDKSKGNNGGWISITAGWGFAVAIAVYCVGSFSGGHFNPAVTIALAAIGKFESAKVFGYIFAQVAGGFIGAVIVWAAYLPHWGATTDRDAKLGVFCTGPAIRHPLGNIITEVVGTFLLVLGVLAITSATNFKPQSELSSGIGPMLVGILVWSIGLSLGGPTGYAINPARDFGPRLAHSLLPIPDKRDSDWAYAWIPIVAPILGGIIGAVFYKSFWPAA
jgi:glycerol uptake facilitator protein